MSSVGIRRRLRRLEGPGGRFLLFAADHGLPAGPLAGLEDLRGAVASLSRSPITGVIVNPGMVRFVPEDLPAALVVHLSAGTRLSSLPCSKVLATAPARAAALGADAVSVQIHFGSPTEEQMVFDVGRVVDEAGALGLPVLVMAYPPGSVDGTAELEATRHAARAAAELGADLVQVPHPGPADQVRAVVRGCPVPVLVTGGPRAASATAFLDRVESAMAGGAAGLCVGRNLFQHPDPAGFARAVAQAVFGPSLVIAARGA